MNWTKYRRTNLAEMRPVTQEDIKYYKIHNQLLVEDEIEISISEPDLLNGSPKIGDMIARNPKSYADQWLVAKDYFRSNFEEI
jgi:hypothetical protein